jgi:hypothetical protein
MFFLIKSIFWLSIVFSAMTWPGDDGPRALATQTAGAITQRARTAAIEKVGAVCTANPKDCLGLAQQTAALAQSLAPAPVATAPRPVRAKAAN